MIAGRVPRKINHEEAKNTKVFLSFLRVLRFLVVDFHSLTPQSLIAPCATRQNIDYEETKRANAQNPEILSAESLAQRFKAEQAGESGASTISFWL